MHRSRLLRSCLGLALARVLHPAFDPLMSDCLSSPLYEIPMSDADLVILGRITITWAQIDWQIDQLLMHVAKLSTVEYKHQYGSKTLPPKIQSLRVFADRLNRVDNESIISACDAIKSCESDRNIMTHGQWG